MKIGDMQIRKGWTARIVSNGLCFRGSGSEYSRTAFTRILMGGGGGGGHICTYTRYGNRYRLDGRRLFISHRMMFLIVFVT